MTIDNYFPRFNVATASDRRRSVSEPSQASFDNCFVMKTRILFALALWCCTVCGMAQDFDKYFEDNTLRIDYIFAGDAEKQDVYLSKLCKQDLWAGRRSRLAETFLEGNGQLTVRDHATHEVLYVWTFSTLFQEWLLTDEAKHVKRSFECSYNIPYPKATIDVTVTLRDKYRKVTTEMTHTVDPKDILIRHIVAPQIPFQYVWKGAGGQQKANSDLRNRTYIPTPYDPMDGVNITDCVDLAILAEGYTEAEMGKFYMDAQRAADALFEREPFKGLKDRFNVVAVAAPSEQSGPSVPKEGIWVNNAANSSYSTFYTDRYLMSSNMHRIYDLLSGVPFEHILVLVNTDTYGGGGIYNQVDFATADHPTFKQVFVHEFGHSYGGLADEYAYDDMDEIWYPEGIEPWEPNVTTLTDFNSKWAEMMPKGTPIPTPLDPKVPDFKKINQLSQKEIDKLNESVHRVGVFEGAGYQSKGCYRPAQECRMKINEVLDFCPVCTRAIQRITDFYTAK